MRHWGRILMRRSIKDDDKYGHAHRSEASEIT
jgi:hypothetical protein